METLRVEINEHIEIVKYGHKGRIVLKYLGIFDSKRQAVKAIKDNFKVKQLDDYSFELEESEQ